MAFRQENVFPVRSDYDQTKTTPFGVELCPNQALEKVVNRSKHLAIQCLNLLSEKSVDKGMPFVRAQRCWQGQSADIPLHSAEMHTKPKLFSFVSSR